MLLNSFAEATLVFLRFIISSLKYMGNTEVNQKWKALFIVYFYDIIEQVSIAALLFFVDYRVL